jgi:signal transduction histidine kinase/ActR/RegA family two-component response regulator
MSATANTIQEKIIILLEAAFVSRVKDLNKSIALTHEALILSEQHDIKSLIAKSLSRLSFYHMIKGEFQQSISKANKATLIYETLKDEQGVADAKFNIASVYYKSDNLHMGLKYLLDCIEIYRKYDDDLNLAKCFKALGAIYEYFGDVENAFDVYQSSIVCAEKVGDLNLKSNVFNPLSGLYLNENNIEKATELIEESIIIKEKTGDVRGLAFAYYGKAKIYSKLKEYELAETYYNKAKDIHKEMDEKVGLGMVYQKMAILFLDQEKFEESRDYGLKALSFSTKYKLRMIKTKSSFLLYQVYKKMLNSEESLKHLEIYYTEVEANNQNHSYQIVDSYKMIHNLAAKALEDKLQTEKTTIIQEKNKAEYIARAKQDFLSNMSHEIRTPLNAVITITNLLKQRADDEDQQLLESLTFASNNLLLLINDVLDFSKLETDKIVLVKRPTNLRNLLNNIKNTYISLAKEKGIQLGLYVNENVVEVFDLDEIKLAQILGNLISNAIKFTDEGSVNVHVRKLADKANFVQLRFSVEDTGAGIADDFLGEIFDSFTQPKAVTTKKHGGSGLGLAIVKKLAGLYGSNVLIKTKLGEGSTFYFDLLLKTSTEKETSTAIENDQLLNIKVLLAEDNKVNMLVAIKLLSRWGVKPDEAKNGLEALEKASKTKYDVILMDIHMPELNGYDATIKIRDTDSINKHTPIYAFTADIIANVKHQYDEYFNGYLLKPIEVNELYRVLKSVNK